MQLILQAQIAGAVRYRQFSAFKGGRPVDAFQGCNLGMLDLRKFIEKQIGGEGITDSSRHLAQAKELVGFW